MIAIIRIKGMVGIRKDLAETLSRLRLRRKYSCVVLDKEGKIIFFEEKPKNPKSEICGTACYFLKKEDKNS